jgi:hypothetical protein
LCEFIIIKFVKHFLSGVKCEYHDDDTITDFLIRVYLSTVEPTIGLDEEHNDIGFRLNLHHKLVIVFDEFTALCVGGTVDFTGTGGVGFVPSAVGGVASVLLAFDGVACEEVAEYLSEIIEIHEEFSVLSGTVLGDIGGIGNELFLS